MSEVKERISVSTFVERYNKLTSEQLKDKYIKEHIKTTYAPILQKKLILEMMNKKSVVETPTKHIDMTVSKLNFVMAILVLYTDIEPDKQENEDGTTTPLTWETYDLLKSSGLYGKILDTIGGDLNELMSVQDYILESWHMANTSTEAYVNNLIDIASRRFGISIELLLDKVIEILEDEKKTKKVMTILDKITKKIK
jgi:hypothetical protein